METCSLMQRRIDLPVNGLEHQNNFDSKKTSSSIEQIEVIPDEDPELKKLATVQRITGNNGLLSHLTHRIAG